MGETTHEVDTHHPSMCTLLTHIKQVAHLKAAPILLCVLIMRAEAERKFVGMRPGPP
jgi:hypothetical protein